MKIMNVLQHKGVAFINNFKITKYNTVLWQNIFGFHGFSFNYESFSINDGLVNNNINLQACYCKSVPQIAFFTLKLKVSFLESFTV